MAVNEILIKRGTPFTLLSSGGSGQFTLNCGSGSGIQSNVFDLGDPHADSYELYAEIVAGAAPTAGTTYDLYLAPANNSGRYPGLATGVDGNYLTGVTISASLVQLSYLGSVVTVNASGIQSNVMTIYPTMRSGCMVLKNSTNTHIVDHVSGLIQLTSLTPVFQTG